MKNILFVLLFGFSINVFAKPVNVNTADAPTIADSLAGVGIKKAEAIVADREKNGPFKSAEDLKRVSGIGDKIVSANKDDILLEAPKPAAPASATPATSAAPAAATPATAASTTSAAPAAPAASVPVTSAVPAKAPEVKK